MPSTAYLDGQEPAMTSATARGDRLEQIRYRVLVVDDRASIHEDFTRYLAEREPMGLDPETFQVLFGSTGSNNEMQFDLSFATQGQEAIELVEASVLASLPYSVAFIDAQMPPGINGLQTISASWAVDPELEVVLITGEYDLEWEVVLRELGRTDRLIVLKKPLDAIEVKQIAVAMSEKRRLRDLAHLQVDELERRVSKRTEELRCSNDMLIREMEERFKVETELRRAQKLESVGRLAAGIAHEINTPIQFIGDSVGFLSEAFGDLQTLYLTVRDRFKQLASDADQLDATNRALEDAEDTADLEFLTQEVPMALQRTSQGVDRVAAIVRGMRVFAPGSDAALVLANLNESIETTLIVSRSEYKYHATVSLDLGEIPPIPCYVGEINQVILNLVVNASHAIADRNLAPGEGRIWVRTFIRDEFAVIEVEDNGGGIPKSAREHVFEPFFTTKSVGRGTGQGLAISYGIITDHHKGAIRFEITEDVGTKFIVELPLSQRRDLLRDESF